MVANGDPIEEKQYQLEVYKYLDETLDSPWSPQEDVKIVAGTSDLHIHATSGRIRVIPLAQQASDAGQRAIVLKSYHCSTMEPAKIAQEAIDAWAKERELRPVRLFGGICMGPLYGGVNPYAIMLAIKFGAKCVWLPTTTARSHITKGVHHVGSIGKESAPAMGDYVLDGDKLIPEVVDIVHMVAEADIILSLGHLGIEEMFAVVEAAKIAGVKKIILDHPHMYSVDVSFENQMKMAELGVYLNYCAAELHPLTINKNTHEIADAIMKIGPEHCTLSTDYGQIISNAPVEALRVYIRILMACGISEDAIDIMARKNPAMLLGLEEEA